MYIHIHLRIYVYVYIRMQSMYAYTCIKIMHALQYVYYIIFLHTYVCVYVCV